MHMCFVYIHTHTHTHIYIYLQLNINIYTLYTHILDMWYFGWHVFICSSTCKHNQSRPGISWWQIRCMNLMNDTSNINIFNDIHDLSSFKYVQSTRSQCPSKTLLSAAQRLNCWCMDRRFLMPQCRWPANWAMPSVFHYSFLVSCWQSKLAMVHAV